MFSLKNYIINSKTLIILPINKTKSRIIEENSELVIDKTPLRIIDESCKYYGSSYKGRVESSKEILNIKGKIPIVIGEQNNLIFFPTCSYRCDICMWICLNNIEDFKFNEDNIILIFSCGKKRNITISKNVFNNQILKASRLLLIMLKRSKKVI